MSASDTTNQSATGRGRKAAGRTATAGSGAAAKDGSAAPAKKRVMRAAAHLEQTQQMPADAQDGQSSAQTRSLRVEPTLGWDEGQWRQRVAEAAYFRAERRGFTGGSPEQDWYEAEDELRRGPNETRA